MISRPRARVHAADYLDFLPTVWPLWEAAGEIGSAIPFAWPTRGLRGDVRPKTIDALLGYYSFDGGAPFVEGTWDAIKSSYDVALTAAQIVKAGERAAFALCRPPGHHAGEGFMGGYCYINNAAVTAQWFRDQGAARRLDPRCRLSSRQRHAADLLRASRRSGAEPAWRPDDRVSVSSSAMPTSTARETERASISTIPCRSAPAGSTWSEALEDACGKLVSLSRRTSS